MADAAKKTDKKTKKPSALKRKLQSDRRKASNKSHRSSVQTAIRHFRESLDKKDSREALQERLNQIYSLVDKGVKRGVYKQQKAARTKARLSSKLVPA